MSLKRDENSVLNCRVKNTNKVVLIGLFFFVFRLIGSVAK